MAKGKPAKKKSEIEKKHKENFFCYLYDNGNCVSSNSRSGCSSGRRNK